MESSREEKSRVESSRVVVNSTASLTFGTNAKWKLNDDKFATSRNLTTDCRRTGVPQNRTYLHTRMPFEAHSVVSNLIRCETFVKAIYAENSAPRPGRQISGLPRFFHIQPSQSDSDWWDELKVFCSVWHIFRFLSWTLDVECQNTYALHSIHTHMRLMCWWWSSSGNWKITHIFNQKRVKSWQKDHRH